MAAPYTKGQESIAQAEHLSPTKTGDNIDAKRTANYIYNPDTSQWERMTAVTGGASIAADTSDLLTEMRILNGSMAMQVDDTTGTIYQGWAEPGTATSSASWRIRKIVSSGTPEDTAITFADGDRDFDNKWTDRATLSYS